MTFSADTTVLYNTVLVVSVTCYSTRTYDGRCCSTRGDNCSRREIAVDKYGLR